MKNTKIIIGGAVIIGLFLFGIIFGMVRGTVASAEELQRRVGSLKAEIAEIQRTCDIGVAKQAEVTALETQIKLLTGTGTFLMRQ